MNFRNSLLAAFLLLLMLVPARAEEGARVILVLDASGSMWGQIDGKSKMEIAKEVVGRVVGNWKPEKRTWPCGLWPSREGQLRRY